MRLPGSRPGSPPSPCSRSRTTCCQQWTKIGPGATTLSLVPETTGPLQATLGALVVIGVAFAYQRSRLGRQLRATREDAAARCGVGVTCTGSGCGAFTLSGALAGSRRLLVHLLGSITTEQVYLELTFLTLAMLVIGGAHEPLGRGRRRARRQRLDSFLSQAEQGTHLLGHKLDLPSGSRLVFLAAIMALVLILRPSGLTGGGSSGSREGAREGLRRRLRGCRDRCSRRTWPTWTASRCGRTTSRGNTSTRSTRTACGSRAPARSSVGRARPPTPPSCPRASSASSRTKAMHTEPAIAATAHVFAEGSVCTVQNGSATRRRSPSTSRA
jgi:hypothetical protein